MKATEAMIRRNLHIVDQIKLQTTSINLINPGRKFPISQVVNDTTFKGNKQYPNKQALWKNVLNYLIFYMFEPRNLAFRNTTNDPTHIITKTEVMIVDADYWVRNAKVAESIKHNKNGPQRSPE